MKGPLAGVEVRADGVPVARSDQDGVALVSLPRQPGKLECSLGGWVAQDTSEVEIQLQGEPCEFLVLVRE